MKINLITLDNGCARTPVDAEAKPGEARGRWWLQNAAEAHSAATRPVTGHLAPMLPLTFRLLR